MSHRLAWVLLTLVTLGAAEPDTGWRFPLGKPLFYRYELTQTTAWRSGGDNLDYRSGMTWVFALRATAIDGPVATVNATVISIEASLDGPAAEVRVDSRTATAANDPIYGHLMGLAGPTLTLTVDQPTGRVTAVAGGDEIIKRINARHPAAVPGEPPPLEATAKRLYSSDALAAWWSQVLAQPATEPQTVPLAPPLTGSLLRTWTSDAFTLALPAGTSDLPVTLVEGVNTVAGTLTSVSGSGRLAMATGVMTKADGTLSYVLKLTALTQAVEQQHTQSWALEPWAPPATPAPAPTPPATGVTHP